MRDIEIQPDTPELWKAEVDFLRDALVSRVIQLIDKVNTIHATYEIEDPIIEEIYQDLGFIAGLLQDDYGFDGTVQ
jgi:hypothetical protein